MSTRTDLAAAVALIAAHLLSHPEDNDMVPGYRLVPKPMSQEERAALTIPLATAARRAKNAERVRHLTEFFRDQLAANPAITDLEMAQALNDRGCVTYKGQPWTERGVAAFKRTIIDKPPAP